MRGDTDFTKSICWLLQTKSINSSSRLKFPFFIFLLPADYFILFFLPRDLSFNKIVSLSTNVFSGLKNLQMLWVTIGTPGCQSTLIHLSSWKDILLQLTCGVWNIFFHDLQVISFPGIYSLPKFSTKS